MNNPQRCACCSYFTIDGIFQICEVCFWQQDSVQEDDINYEGGANTVSLVVAKNNFKKFGAIEERFIELVRPPFTTEIVDIESTISNYLLRLNKIINRVVNLANN